MKKIFDWIKVNILGLEEPRKRRAKKRTVRKAKPAPKKKNVKVLKKAVKAQPKTKPKLQPKAQALKAALKKPLKQAVVIKPAKVKAVPAPKFLEKKSGVITHFFPNVSAAIVKMNGVSLEIGDEIRFKGPVTDFTIRIKSMQMNRAPILIAEKGQEIGIQVPDKVREGDLVLKLIPKK